MKVDAGNQGFSSETAEKAVKVDDAVKHQVEGNVEEKEAVKAHEIREGVKTDRLRRALAASTLTNLRGSQKW